MVAGSLPDAKHIRHICDLSHRQSAEFLRIALQKNRIVHTWSVSADKYLRGLGTRYSIAQVADESEENCFLERIIS